MGTWGDGAFDNDDAADWRYRLLDGGGVDVVAEALHAGSAVPAPPLPVAARAVAAAALVGGAVGVAVELPDDMTEWLGQASIPALRDLAPDAVDALGRVLDRSELAELWGEGDGEGWLDRTRGLRDALAAAG